MDLGVQASLVVATMDLKLVQLLRGAMRAADCAADVGCGVIGACPIGVRRLEDRFDRRFHHVPSPIIEPRKRIIPTPRFDPRPVVHPTPIVAEPASIAAPCPIKAKAAPVLWQTPIARSPNIKVTVLRPDVISKGSLIDLFM